MSMEEYEIECLRKEIVMQRQEDFTTATEWEDSYFVGELKGKRLINFNIVVIYKNDMGQRTREKLTYFTEIEEYIGAEDLVVSFNKQIFVEEYADALLKALIN